MRERWSGVDYRSCDLDRRFKHDYHDWDEIDRQFDLVICIEDLEHFSPEQGLYLALLMSRAGAPGGHVLATVPNVHTPGYQLEFIHRTAFGFFDLAAIIELSGLNVVKATRVSPNPSRMYQFVHQRIFGWLHRVMRVGYCQSVAVLGQK